MVVSSQQETGGLSRAFPRLSGTLCAGCVVGLAAAGPWLTVASRAVALQAGAPAAVQEPAAPQSVPQAVLQAAVDKLGDLDYASRSTAARTVRRTPASQAVPVLLRAVSEHTDGYVR